MLRKVALTAVLSVLAAALVVPVGAAAKPALSHSDRRGIDRTLDAFIPLAVARKDPAAAERLVTSDIRTSSTKAEWRRGDIAVYPFPARGKRFHYWALDYVDGNTVGVHIMLRPQKAAKKVGPIIFDIDLQRHGKRWLVANLSPAAVFSPEGSAPKIITMRDLGPAAGEISGKSRINPKLGALIPLGFLGLVLLLAGGVWGRGRLRERRAEAQYGGPRSLPPLPRRFNP